MRTNLILCLLLLPLPAMAQEKLPEQLGTAENQAVLNRDPVQYESDEGLFSATFPSGCGKIVQKIPNGPRENDEGVLQPLTFISYCDRFDKKGEGCSITLFMNYKGAAGGFPKAPDVVERIQAMLGTMGVEIKHQQRYQQKLADGSLLDGMDVLAVGGDGVGEAWIRGMLHGADIVLLTAWNSDGTLSGDPEYIHFFNSFKP